MRRERDHGQHIHLEQQLENVIAHHHDLDGKLAMVGSNW